MLQIKVIILGFDSGVLVWSKPNENRLQCTYTVFFRKFIEKKNCVRINLHFVVKCWFILRHVQYIFKSIYKFTVAIGTIMLVGFAVHGTLLYRLTPTCKCVCVYLGENCIVLCIRCCIQHITKSKNINNKYTNGQKNAQEQIIFNWIYLNGPQTLFISLQSNELVYVRVQHKPNV